MKKMLLEDYKRFMNGMLQKDYAWVVPEVQPYGKTWYISHHGIWHHIKTGKIWVVFNFSAKFNDKSINKELLKGPDLKNQLVVVLISFRQEQVAVNGNITRFWFLKNI